MGSELKFCFIGIGSIAKRHIKNLKSIFAGKNIQITIDAVRRQKTYLGAEGIDNVYTDLNELGYYNAVFITNPTAFHVTTLKGVRDKAEYFFIEKPITSLDKIEEAEHINYINQERSYVACPLRYKKVIQYIKNYVKNRRVIGVRAISSSYLPEWRPGQDYKNTYSAHKELGGGVSIDLIHEWDYLRNIFGMPNKISYFKGRKSNLDIDTEDTALYLAEYDDLFVELHLDYFGRKAIRECMIFTNEETIAADLLNNNVKFLNSGKQIDFTEDRDDFQIEELKHFLDIIDGARSNNTIEDAVQTMYLSQGEVIGG